MVEKKITVTPAMFLREGEGPSYVSSVSVATPDALVVISDLTIIDGQRMSGYVVVTEDEDE